MCYVDRSAILQTMPRGRYYQLKRMQLLLNNQSEDCLYLNVYVPSGGNRKLRHSSHWSFHYSTTSALLIENAVTWDAAVVLSITNPNH